MPDSETPETRPARRTLKQQVEEFYDRPMADLFYQWRWMERLSLRRIRLRLREAGVLVSSPTIDRWVEEDGLTLERFQERWERELQSLVAARS